MALLAPALIPEPRIASPVASRVILRLVPELQERTPARVKRAGFATVLSLVLVGGLLALLGLNLVLAKNSFALHDLRQESRSLSHVEQALTEHLSRVQSPQVLAQRATTLGMVPGEKVTFLRVPAQAEVGVVAEGRP
jgi:hypothetical protein